MSLFHWALFDATDAQFYLFLAAYTVTLMLPGAALSAVFIHILRRPHK